MDELTTELFSCRDLGKVYGSRRVLNKVSLAIHAGEVVGIVGPNGAGKTTLFEILSGRSRPSEGGVFLEGRDITGLAQYERARMGIARTYQSPVVPEALSVREVFEAARLAYRPFCSAHDVQAAIDLVGLQARAGDRAGDLGTLERRKLLMACLLMRRPKVLLMDEPAAGLSNDEIGAIDASIRHVSKELDVAVLLVEHRMELLESVAQSVHVLDMGEQIAHGMPSEVFKMPRVRAAYFDSEAVVS